MTKMIKTGVYATPKADVLEMSAEGVLCASNEDWDEEILPQD